MFLERISLPSILFTLLFGCANNIAEELVEDCSEAENFYIETIAPIMSQNCVSCHSGPSSSGNQRLDSFLSVYSSIEVTLDRVNRDPGSAGFMPLGGNKLTNEQIAALQAFIEMDCE